ncbi:MAG TPA: 30S ribosomal protein S6 [Candidatus Omnitrophota bacterium]|nr:30S ribosomal protein S6 [Candidatus Omnitrophota bacterium]
MTGKKMKKYELVVIIDSKLNSDDKQTVVKEVTEAINKTASKVINAQVWFEKQKMFFPIKKCQEGTYYLINFEAKPEAVNKIKAVLRVNERILRCAFTAVAS